MKLLGAVVNSWRFCSHGSHGEHIRSSVEVDVRLTSGTGITSRGWQKTEMKRTDARQVASSKRRPGLFKKASKICTLCAVETAVVIFSPGVKACSFGHTDVDKLGHPWKPDSTSTQLTQTDQQATLQVLNKEYTDLLEQLEAEKKRGEELDQMRRELQGQCWMYTPIDELNLKDLLTLKGSLENLKVKLVKQIQDVSVQNSTTTPSSAGNSAIAVDPSATNPAGDSYR